MQSYYSLTNIDLCCDLLRLDPFLPPPPHFPSLPPAARIGAALFQQRWLSQVSGSQEACPCPATHPRTRDTLGRYSSTPLPEDGDPNAACGEGLHNPAPACGKRQTSHQQQQCPPRHPPPSSSSTFVTPLPVRYTHGFLSPLLNRNNRAVILRTSILHADSRVRLARLRPLEAHFNKGLLVAVPNISGGSVLAQIRLAESLPQSWILTSAI